MTGHEFLSGYPAKLMEYALAVGYLILFIPFWRYVQGAKAARKRVAVQAPARAAEAHGVLGWFHVPENVHLHPGHTWARMEEDGSVTVGLDDFAHKLVGRVAAVSLPEPGAQVAQGELAARLAADSKTVGLLSPVDGTVVAVNRAAAEEPGRLEDPYGKGWLFQVKPPRFAANVRQLFSGAAAREWLEGASQALAARLSPQLGHVLQDGGTPVNGIARELDPEHWDEIARTFFRT
jgi:glycine cleavage system H protein